MYGGRASGQHGHLQPASSLRLCEQTYVSLDAADHRGVILVHVQHPHSTHATRAAGRAISR